MAAAPTAESVRGALLRYRVMAFVVGTTLLIFCVAIVLKYVTKTIESDSIVAIAHGWLFMIYVLLGLDLGFRMRWSLGRRRRAPGRLTFRHVRDLAGNVRAGSSRRCVSPR